MVACFGEPRILLQDTLSAHLLLLQLLHKFVLRDLIEVIDPKPILFVVLTLEILDFSPLLLIFPDRVFDLLRDLVFFLSLLVADDVL